MIELTAAGLTASESKCYTELVRHTDIAPTQLAKAIGQTRTNTYKLLDSLVASGLAEKFEYKNKLRYRAANPQRLLELARERREEMLNQEKVMESHVSNLQKEYFQVSEQPGIRFYQGKDSIGTVFEDMIKTGKDIYLLRSPHDTEFMGKDFYINFKKRRALAGINTYIYSADIESATHDPKADRLNNMFRTWLPADAYTAAVEWNIYDNKVAIISYGKEAFATVIESPQIAESLRQILTMKKVTD